MYTPVMQTRSLTEYKVNLIEGTTFLSALTLTILLSELTSSALVWSPVPVHIRY